MSATPPERAPTALVAPVVRIRLFGQITVESDERKVAGQGFHFGLLAYVALQPAWRCHDSV